MQGWGSLPVLEVFLQSFVLFTDNTMILSPQGVHYIHIWYGKVPSERVSISATLVSNSTYFHNLGVRNGIDFQDFGMKYKLGYTSSKNWCKGCHTLSGNWYKAGYTIL